MTFRRIATSRFIQLQSISIHWLWNSFNHYRIIFILYIWNTINQPHPQR
uniref:Uncharacterized protein n=1 Tax=Ascaris lumbricoides TaxID=6252 RepID=A0A0M3I6M9_ASCLU